MRRVKCWRARRALNQAVKACDWLRVGLYTSGVCRYRDE